MSKHLERDLAGLKKKLLALGAIVEDATKKSIEALVEGRLDLAQEVIRGDQMVDEREVQFEEECLKVLALNAPVAADLRMVIAFLKANNDLERIGDLAKNIAQRAEFLAARGGVEVPQRIHELAARVREMLRDTLDSVVNTDLDKARSVIEQDEEVDRLHGAFYAVTQERLVAHPERTEEIIQILSVSRYLERIADQATNIAEDVVFMVEGEVIRHQG
jgi:phosphate transport system protein